jgi:hypothetical protein
MPLPTALGETRTTLHRLAAHVLGRRRHAVTGRFGLRASPGGFATPAFGDGPEVVRVSGAFLVHETVAGASYLRVTGSTLRELATFVGADIDAGFTAGPGTPGTGDVDAAVAVDAAACEVLAAWFAVGWCVLDDVVASLGAGAAPAVVQLWPEHFDAATHVGVPGGRRCNLGVSPGDGYRDEPYAYVGPWDAERPGDAGYWNAPFGAVLPWTDAHRDGDPAGAVRAFLEEGLGRLGRG